MSDNEVMLASETSMATVSNSSLLLDVEAMKTVYQAAELMASGISTVPKHLQKNPSDCMAVIMQALQWGMNHYAVGQKTHLVNGALGYESQLIIAVINARAPIKDRLKFSWGGDWSKAAKDTHDPSLTAKVWATFRGETDPTALEISMKQVGTVRNSPLWAADPRQQLAYLCAKRWARLYCPDVILGVYSPDELDEPRIRDVTPRSSPQQIAEAARQRAAGNESERAELIGILERSMREHGVEGVRAAWNCWTKEQRATVGIGERNRILETKPPADDVGNSAPTAADIMPRIANATSGDDIQQILSDSSHLSDAEQSDIVAACSVRMKEINNHG